MISRAPAPARPSPSTVARLFAVLLLAAAALLAARPAEAAPTAAGTVDALLQGLTAAMNDPAADSFAEREALLRPLMEGTFDYPYMAEVAAGRYWKDLDAATQERYVALFGDVSVAAAADRFRNRPGAGFTVTGEREGPDGTRFIETELTLPSGKNRTIAYLLRETEPGNWRAVDLFFDSTISELATKRSEYTSVIKSQGIEVLLQKLEEKKADYGKE